MAPIPSGPKLPSSIQLLHWLYRPIPFMEQGARRYGDCFTVRLPANPPLVFFSSPEAVKDIFAGDPEKLPAGRTRAIVQPLVGQHSVLVTDGARHAQQRKLLMPPFHGERMQAYSTIMADITDQVIDRWPVGRPFPIQAEMQEITLNVILRTVFGIEEGTKFTQLRALLIELLSLGTNPLNLIPWFPRLLGPFTNRQRLMQLIGEVDKALYEAIAQRRAVGTEGRSDILSMLLEARDEQGQPLTDVELRDELVTMLVAGHETTATSLSWTFHHLLQQPEVVERLKAELRHVVGDGPVQPQHLQKLDYLDAAIKEAQRLTPIVPVVGRYVREPVRIGGRDLPAGVVATACIYLTHHHPDVWPNPKRFDPDRFLAKRPSPYEFFPFGGGNRYCLGAAFALYEMKIVLTRVLSRVTLRAAPGRTVRVVRRGVTFAPSEGMPVVLDRLAA
ncbi:MAG: cytochrome P450 [Deltaproteobacteria bacterium]|nr:cytochrome P450 [Deltaproteobacteria bacterium]